MSEHNHQHHEQHEVHPTPTHPEHQPAGPEQHELEAAQAKHHELAAEARDDIAETAGNQHNVLDQLEAEESTPQVSTPGMINRDLKRLTLQRELQAIRRKLPAGERRLSKVVHQPLVRVVSESAAKTVSRPSGMLGGGLVAFLGSVGYLYLAKHVGFTYNYLVFLLLFAGGFLLGVLLELLVYMALSSRRRAHD